jgi:hypothetical protein
VAWFRHFWLRFFYRLREDSQNRFILFGNHYSLFSGQALRGNSQNSYHCGIVKDYQSIKKHSSRFKINGILNGKCWLLANPWIVRLKHSQKFYPYFQNIDQMIPPSSYEWYTPFLSQRLGWSTDGSFTFKSHCRVNLVRLLDHRG